MTWGTKSGKIADEKSECLTVSNLGTKAACITTGFAANGGGLAFGPVPAGGMSIKDLRVESSEAVSFTATVLKNGTATELTCKATTATTCSDETHTVTIAAGEYVEVKVKGETFGKETAFAAAFRY